MQINITQTENSRLKDINFDELVFGSTMTDHMLVAYYKDGQWSQVEIKPYGNISLSPAAQALHYGQAIFEGMKAYKNDKNETFLFRIQDNLERINLSAKRLMMPEIPEEIFTEGLKQLVALEKEWIPTKEGSSLYLRPFMFASGGMLKASVSEEYMFMIICSPVNNYYSQPLNVKIEQKYSRSANGGVGFAKAAGNYAASFYPTHLAQQEGYDQLIWTDAATHTYIEESGTMNIMIVYKNKIVTPPLRETILNSVTRRSILQLAQEMGIETEEKNITVDEVISGIQSGEIIEMFGCGTAVVVMNYKKVGYNGTDYTLPTLPIEESIAQQIKQKLIAIQMGNSQDSYNWITVV